MPAAVWSCRMVFQLTLPVWGATLRSLGLSDWELFQLTLPVWGATKSSIVTQKCTTISTHAPRVGSDGRLAGTALEPDDFNSRSPCGERH